MKAPARDLARCRAAPHIRLMADPAQRNACPICGKPSEQRFRPFCSRAAPTSICNRWLSGVYAVPVVAEEEDDDLPNDASPAEDDASH